MQFFGSSSSAAPYREEVFFRTFSLKYLIREAFRIKTPFFQNTGATIHPIHKRGIKFRTVSVEPDVSPKVWIPESTNNKYIHNSANGQFKIKFQPFFKFQKRHAERFISTIRTVSTIYRAGGENKGRRISTWKNDRMEIHLLCQYLPYP